MSRNASTRSSTARTSSGDNAPALQSERDQFTTASLKKLQSDDERKLLDVVDKLRRTGLNGTIELPQLVVCGDQSSGKSSVLEAITEIPFPRKAGLCTRIATEIVMRRQPTTCVTVRINPSKGRSTKEQKKLAAFNKTITDLNHLPEIIDDAMLEMGLGKIGQSAAFARDILSVEISGPDRPQLTLVDLPGLIHSATKAQSEQDKDLIFELVQSYMSNPRTIILAVVSAKNDMANQIILSLVKKIDVKSSRTLGIITKPDCISAGDEATWFGLALNKEIFLQRGWHMIKNRSDAEVSHSFAQRNAAEKKFFDSGRFKELPRSSVGIESLRTRLSTLLHRHLVQELPSLKQEMKLKLEETTDEIAGLGAKRETTQEQKMVVTSISQEINLILRDSINGTYRHTFFDPVDMEAPITEGPNVRRFRALIQDLNRSFAEYMLTNGQKFKQKLPAPAPTPAPASQPDTQPVLQLRTTEIAAPAMEDLNIAFHDSLPKPMELTEADIMKWVKKVMLRCRGLELPGSVNPEVTSHLFWEQSEPWQAIAEAHVEQVRAMCRNFVNQVLEHVAPPVFKKPLEELVVDAVLEDTLNDAKAELNKILLDNARHPSTYNNYYTETVQKRRQDKHKQLAAQAKKEAMVVGTRQVDPEVFQQKMLEAVHNNMETFAAEETLESSRAYYKDEMKYFVHAVTKQVIERCMIEPLAERILSPTVVQGLTDEEIAFIAAEPPETTAHRNFLEERKRMLNEGFKFFQEAMGGLKRTRSQAFGS